MLEPFCNFGISEEGSINYSAFICNLKFGTVFHIDLLYFTLGKSLITSCAYREMNKINETSWQLFNKIIIPLKSDYKDV